jgi:hypothetical protein
LVGFIDFTTKFKYLDLLDSITYHYLTSDEDADKRISSATAAFRALQEILTDRDNDLTHKGKAHVENCLSILLFCCEIRGLREDLFIFLRSDHVPHLIA